MLVFSLNEDKILTKDKQEEINEGLIYLLVDIAGGTFPIDKKSGRMTAYLKNISFLK